MRLIKICNNTRLYFCPNKVNDMQLFAETIFSPTGPPVAPLPSAIKVYNQDSDAPSPIREEPLVVAEPSRPRPSTVTVIHTGTKWRQVPREVSWETTELWDGMKPSQASWFKVVAQFAYPATSHLFLPNHGRNLRSVDSAPFTMAQHGTALLSFPLSYTPGSTEGRCSKEVVIVEVMFSLDDGDQAEKQAAGLGSATLKGNLYRCCHLCELWASWDKEAPLYALCKYPWNCWVWSHVMQVKYKLQAVVNCCDIICTLNFSSFWQLLLICCGICYNGSQGNNSQQCDSMCYLFALKCVDMKYEQDSVLQSRLWLLSEPVHCTNVLDYLFSYNISWLFCKNITYRNV